MVMDNILKVNSTDPKVEELRKRLAALQQKAPIQTQPVAISQPSQAPSQTSTPQTTPADMAKLVQLSAEEQQRLAERNNPETRLKEERTLTLIMNQIKELINLHNEASKRIKDMENKNASLEKELEMFKGKHDEVLQKMNSIDSRLEKFMGLYELVTNQYNPFADQKFTLPEVKKAALPTPAIPAPPQKADTFKIEDTLTKQAATIAIPKEDTQKAQQEFKRVEEMLADLHQQQGEKQASQALTQELHTLLSGFEERLKTQFDQSLQDKLHQGFSLLEQRLQSELRDALKEEIAAIQEDDKEVQQALNELQELMQASETKNRAPVEDELSELTTEIKRLQDEVKSIPPNMYFRVVDGTILKELADLKRALQTMSPEVFNRHVFIGRNDFADWVEHALQLPLIANQMRKVNNQLGLLRAISGYEDTKRSEAT